MSQDFTYHNDKILTKHKISAREDRETGKFCLVDLNTRQPVGEKRRLACIEEHEKTYGNFQKTLVEYSATARLIKDDE